MKIEPRFAEVGDFVEGVARVVLDGYCHIASPEGYGEGTPTTGYPSSCRGVPSDAVEPCRVGFVDEAGQFAIEPRFAAARDFSEGRAAVQIDGAWGFIDAKGRIVIAPRFERAQSFREGLAGVRVDGRWGFIDEKGNLTVAAQFENVEPFSEGFAIAYQRGKPFYIDRSGRVRLRGHFLEAAPFVRGLAAVRLGPRQVHYIDRTGKVVFRYWRKLPSDR